MVYKTILLSLVAFALYGQMMLYPNRSDILNPPSSGGGIGAAFDSAGTTISGYDNNVFAFDNWAQIGVNYTAISGDKSLGAVAIHVNAIQGDLSGVNFECVVTTNGGSKALGSAIATSTARELANGWCQFDFTSGVTLTASTEYFIVVRRVDKSFSGDDYAFVDYGTGEWVTGDTGSSCDGHLWVGSTDANYDYFDNPYTFRLYVWE